MSGTGRNRPCPSVLWAAPPWLPATEIAPHDCHGPAGHTGKHYCGCGPEMDWTTAQAEESAALVPANQRRAHRP